MSGNRGGLVTVSEQILAQAKMNAEYVVRARLVVCQHAKDVAEANELLGMLGILPGQDENSSP